MSITILENSTGLCIIIIIIITIIIIIIWYRNGPKKEINFRPSSNVDLYMYRT